MNMTPTSTSAATAYAGAGLESIKSKTEAPPTETGAGHRFEALAFEKGGLFLPEANFYYVCGVIRGLP